MGEEKREILEHLVEYLQDKMDTGYHKIFYNDDMYDEKTIDCINAINDTLEENNRLNKIIDKAIKKLKFIDEYFTKNEILQMYQLIQNHKEVLEILDKVGDEK